MYVVDVCVVFVCSAMFVSDNGGRYAVFTVLCVCVYMCLCIHACL